jgi:hypothetical protein
MKKKNPDWLFLFAVTVTESELQLIGHSPPAAAAPL